MLVFFFSYFLLLHAKPRKVIILRYMLHLMSGERRVKRSKQELSEPRVQEPYKLTTLGLSKKGFLKKIYGSNVKVIVTCKGDILINRPHTLPPTFTSHNHEEADTQIPLLLLNSLSDNTCKHFDVYTPDTDILVVLMDLISNGYAGPLTSIILHAGKARSPRQ